MGDFKFSKILKSLKGAGIFNKLLCNHQVITERRENINLIRVKVEKENYLLNKKPLKYD